MPSVETNYKFWSKDYDWPEGGDEWSGAWGGTHYMWWVTIFPRIYGFLPTGNILEIAPGFGRCTRYLQNFCNGLTIVDLSDKCINACKKRFRSNPRIKPYVNDGKSLSMVPDCSIDFIFSWDSLVHADKDVLKEYIRQFPRILRPGGFGFIHHSNLGSYVDEKTNKMTRENKYWRDETMTAELFEKYCTEAGVQCVLQEKNPWGSKDILCDCFSVFTYNKAPMQGVNRVLENTELLEEMSKSIHNKGLFELYNRAYALNEEGNLSKNRSEYRPEYVSADRTNGSILSKIFGFK